VGFSLANAVFGSELIQSVDVAPNPLVTGRTFAVSVNATTDVTQAMGGRGFSSRRTKVVVDPTYQTGLKL
jgi:hypothetical protein